MSVLIFSLKFFQSTPIEQVFFRVHALFIIWSASFVFLYTFSFILKRRHIDRVIVFYIAIIIFLPIYGAVRANEVFNQPIIYGVLSERNWFSIGAGIWFYHALRNRTMSLYDFERAFVIMAWLSLISFTIIAATVDASSIESLNSDNSFVVDTENRGIRFKFQMYFITFGAIYYLIKFDFDKSIKYLFFTFLFLTYIFTVFQGRTYIIYLILTYLIYYVSAHSIIKIVPRIAAISVTVFISIIIINVFNSSYLDNFITMFDQMFSVLQGEKSTDSSANSRLIQSDIIINFFRYNPDSIWFGSGAVSHQWRDGYEGLFGYFHPIDTGILGGTFVYGIFGILITTLYPLVVSIKAFLSVGKTNNMFIKSFKYIIVFYLFGMFQGSFQFKYTELCIPLFIIVALISRQTSYIQKIKGS